MLKSLKSVLIVCLAAVFGAFIVLEAIGYRGREGAAQTAAAPSENAAEKTDGILDAEEEQKSESLSFLTEPEANEVVTVLVGVKGTPLLDVANERGVTVRELYEGFDGSKLLGGLEEGISAAKASLAPYLIQTGYAYTSAYYGFSATVRYGDIARIEKSDLIDHVILSTTYESPKAITENTVDVQDTGIFNSVGVGYDGTGTVVAVLDTGTDYTHEVFDMELDPETMALTKDDVARAVPLLTATTMSELAGAAEFDEDELYLTSKLPYAFDYADIDTDVYPEEAHGTHVAGIIGGESQRIRGVAPRTQIATFKVFKDTGSSSTEGILAAVNDAVVLGVDAINMSLGATCGFSREEDEPHVNEVYDRVEESGISLVVAAGNEYSSSYGGAHGNTNLASNPDSGTVGSPASYYASLAVASVSGIKTPYMIVNGEKDVYYNESRTTGKTKPNNFVNELLGDKASGEYEYVVIPGVGYEANYTGYDVNGKIAVVKRGSNSFEDKVKIARSLGAVAVIIYNNLSGMLNMSIGTTNLTPSCLVSMDYGEYFVAHPTGKLVVSKDYLAGPFMSDFSSWGPLPNLELTPDITGHGGDITSSFPGRNEYDTISGTSMACPNIAGALVLVREYVKNMGDHLSATEVRNLSYNLMMSTAAIVRNEDGNPYSPRKQGAGIGDIRRSVTTKAYISVEGSNKPKLSLKDDPTRKGVYELTFNVTNMSSEALSYKINPIVMTESMSSDEKTVAEKAYLLSPSCTYAVTAKAGQASVKGTTLSIGGYAEAQLTVTVTLSDQDRTYLEEHFVNGMYVEGYVELQSYNADKINLNIPYLAFYGDWTDAPMLDVSAYEVGESAVDSSVLEEDKLVADVYGTLPMAGFVTLDDYGNEETGSWGLGAFGYNVAQGYELPVTREQYASLSHNVDCNYLLYAIGAGLFRNAKRVDMEIRDSVTGDLIWSKIGYNARKSHSNGGDQAGGSILVDFDVRNYNLANNGKYTFSMACYLDWGENGELYGNRNTFSFDFYIDDEKPILLKDESGDYEVYVRDENHRKTVEFNVYDNHYLQGFILYTYEGTDRNGDPTGLTSISNGVIPVYDGEFKGTTRVSLDVTSYWSTIQKNGGKLYVQFMDYAKNNDQFFVKLKECNDLQLEKTRNARDDYTVNPGSQLELEDYVTVKAMVRGEYYENYWVKDLVWSSDNEGVATVEKGLVTGISGGSATITVHPADGAEGNSLTFTINVPADGTPGTVSVRGIELSDYSLSLERGEEFVISATLKPSRFNDTAKLTWASSSGNVTVTPIEGTNEARVKAIRSGSASINVRVDGTYINATCSVRVKEEYYVDTVYLRSYTGRGDENGVVTIPDDLGIAYIYPMAFYDNPYITKIVIPEGVQYIMRAGIYGCDNLEEIVLPESCTQLQTFSVAWNPKLKKINTEHIQTIGSRAFIFDTALETIDLSRTTYISDMAFTNCTSLKSVDLSKVGVVGQQAFMGCTSLTELVLPANTATMAGAFYQCTNLRRVKAYNSYLGPMTFQYCTALTDVTFYGDVEKIDAQAFYGCTALQNVNFRGSVYEIGALAFGYATSLSSFTLPAGLSKLGQYAFVNATGLSSITIDKDACIPQSEAAAFVGIPSLTEFNVEAGNKYLSSANGVLYDKTQYRLIAYPYGRTAATFTVPDSVRVIGANAFTSVSSITSVNLNNVERVEDSAFRQCTAQFTGGNNVTYIGAYAFAASLTAPSGLRTFPIAHATYIGDHAFENCYSATQTTLTLPDTLTYLGENAFANCTAIRTVNLGNGLTSAGRGAFAGCTSLVTVNFGSLTEIAPEMFRDCTGLRTVGIPGTVTVLGEGAFRGATGLASVTLPEGLAAIPAYAFYGTALRSVDVPATVVTIGEAAFRGTSLTYFDLTKVQSVGAGAFENTSLASVNSSSLTGIGERAFSGSAVKSVTAPNVKTIGNYAFAYCEDLTSVSIPAAADIGAYAFEDCVQLTSVEAAAASSVGAYAFRGAEALTEIDLPALRTVGEAAFEGTSVTGLNLPALRTVAVRAFSGAEKLQAITVDNANYKSEDGVLYQKNSGNFFTLIAYPLGKTGTSYEVIKRTVKIGAYAFENNKTLTSITLPEHLKAIGAGAFYGASVTRIEILAVAAPTLESMAVAVENDLINTYNNFKVELGKGFTLQWIAPENATGYDVYIWQTYMGDRIETTGEKQINASALDFIDRVKALDTLTGEARSAEIALLLRIYNMLNTDQRAFVTGDYDDTDYYALLKAAEAGGTVSFTGTETALSPSAGEESGAGFGSIVCLVLVALAACGTVAVICGVRAQKRRK